MTEITNKQKIKLNNKRDEVHNFLNNHRLTEEAKDKGLKYTHLAYGGFRGSFILNEDAYKEFLKIYSDAVEIGVTDLSILEGQKDYGPIIIDLDFQMPVDTLSEVESKSNVSKRLYSNKMIEEFLKIYYKAIAYHLDVKPEDNKSYVFEKASSQYKEDHIKDGLHIMFPDIIAHYNIRHLIRNKVINLCKESQIFEHFPVPPEKIIDKAVVSSNAWYIYGSKKYQAQEAYKLSKIYNSEVKITYDNITKMSYDYKTGNTAKVDIPVKDLIKKLSLQHKRYKKKNMTKLSEQYPAESDINAECEKNGVNDIIKSCQNKYDLSPGKEDEIKQAIILTEMLSSKRADDRCDWLNVGLVLHNIDESLEDIWDKFSKRSSKFKDGECEKKWKSFRKPMGSNLLTVGSLRYWAKMDSPKEYADYLKLEFKTHFNKSYNGDHNGIAKCIHTKYRDRYVCSNLDRDIWWEFKNHKWVQVSKAYTLKLLLSDEFANEYNMEIIRLSDELIRANGCDRDTIAEKRKKVEKIYDRLRNNAFKKSLLDEASSMFHDDKFNEKLNSNLYLVGFNNGVYDLEKGEFREGRPDDFISFSTKNDYIEWTDRNPYKKHIDTFFSQIITNKNVRDYFLTVLSTCIAGDIKDEKFYMLTGSGSNGKSLTMELVAAALGDYYMTCNVALLTQKRAQSGAAAPDLIRTKGRRCGVYQEADENEQLNTGFMKQLVSDKVTCRDLYKGSDDMVDFKPQMKQFLTCNQLPTIKANDDGTWRRIAVIDFASKFTFSPASNKTNEFLIDKKLKEKILDWSPSFSSYLIHIYNTTYKNAKSFEPPEEVNVYTNQYKAENDFYTEYDIERITHTGNKSNTISLEVIWEDFKVWYKGSNPNAPLPKRQDFKKFADKKYKHSKLNYINIIFTSSITDTVEESSNDKKSDFDV
jgi:P4 family phage/plasmid primase-like protien